MENHVICELLECGIFDLDFLDEVLENTKVELWEVIEEMKFDNTNIEINSILYFLLRQKVYNTLKNIEEIEGVENDELEEIKEQIEQNFYIYANCIDTHIIFESLDIEVYPRETDEEMENTFIEYIKNNANILQIA